MPVPYAIPGWGYVKSNALLGALGTGATPSQVASEAYVQTISAKNASPVTLTGSNQSLANVAPTIAKALKFIISGTVACDFTGVGEPPTDQLEVNLTINGSPIFAPGLLSDLAQGGATVSFTTEFDASPGTISIHLEAKVNDGGTPFTVAVNAAQLIVQVVSV